MKDTQGASRMDGGALNGALSVFAAESLLIPVGLIIVAYLSRRLSIEQYGHFVLAVSLIGWLEWGIASLFTRSTYQLIAAAADWRGPAATIVWMSGAAGLAAGGAVFLSAPAIARALGAPAITPALRILAFDMPLFCLAQAHRNIAAGLGWHHVRALATAGRLAARLALVLSLVGLGFSIEGALVAHVGASMVELALCRLSVRPGWWRDPSFPPALVITHAWPLFLSALAMRLFERLDLLMLQRLREAPAETALFGAAQQLATLPLLFSAALVPALASTLANLRSTARNTEAAHGVLSGIRAALLLVPVVAIPAGSGADIARLIFGEQYAGAGPIVAPLLFATACYVIVYATSAAIIAAGRPGWTVRLTFPMLAAAAIAQIVVIPPAGAVGAAWVSLAVGAAGALAGIATAAQLWSIGLSVRTVATVMAVSLLVYLTGAALHGRGWLLLPEMAGLGIAGGALLYSLGAITRADLALLRRSVRPLRDCPRPRRRHLE